MRAAPMVAVVAVSIAVNRERRVSHRSAAQKSEAAISIAPAG